MKLIVYGDSHGYSGWPGEFIQHYYGPLLCYTIGTKKWQVMDISLYNDVEDDTVCIFCFGEIDCRCHIKKHITEKNTYEKIIDKIVFNYLETIKENVEKTGKKPIVYVYNVVPPSKESEVAINNEQFPFVGTDEERKLYTLYFNKKLKEMCPKYKFGFFDIYNHYVTEEGFLNRNLSDENVHIRDGFYIHKFIEENIKNKKS